MYGLEPFMYGLKPFMCGLKLFGVISVSLRPINSWPPALKCRIVPGGPTALGSLSALRNGIAPGGSLVLKSTNALRGHRFP